MRKRGKVGIAATLVVVSAVAAIALGVALRRQKQPPSWRPEAEGLLAIVSTDPALWDRIGVVPEDARQVQPATATEAAEWLNSWPYRAQGEHPARNEDPLLVSAQNAEIRCSGPPEEPSIVPEGDDRGTLTAIQQRRACKYVKWKVWAGETAKLRQNERHTVWVDEAGRFRGRVDYWR